MSAKKVSSADAELGTRDRLLQAAVECLIELGVAGTSTLAVQRQANVSRGALLHYFPNRETLLAASISALVERNEHAVKSFRDSLPQTEDRLTSAVAALAYAARQPAYLAELELWAVARTDRSLRATLVSAERAARREIERVHMQLFGDLAMSEECAEVVALTQHFIRGLAVSENVQISPRRRDQLIVSWTEAMRPMLERGMKEQSARKA